MSDLDTLLRAYRVLGRDEFHKIMAAPPDRCPVPDCDALCPCDRCRAESRCADLRRGIVSRRRVVLAAMNAGAVLGALSFFAYAFFQSVFG